jgi:hypothetical protein
MVEWTLIGIGAALVSAGLLCGFMALQRTKVAVGKGKFLPSRTQAWRWPFRRKNRILPTQTQHIGLRGSATVRRTRPAIPIRPVEAAIDELIRRVEAIERQADGDRDSIQRRVEEQEERLNQQLLLRTRRIDESTRDLVGATLALEAWGLLFVLLGTILMAVGGIVR